MPGIKKHQLTNLFVKIFRNDYVITKATKYCATKIWSYTVSCTWLKFIEWESQIRTNNYIV